MVDWTASMEQTFEYYVVDPNTWKDTSKLTNVKTANISRDLTVDTLGSATIDVTESVGECYIRIYMITVQNGIREKHPLGTFLVQTPNSTYDGKIRNVSMDAYTPLLELKEKQPPLGFSLMDGDNVMSNVYRLTRENLRAPVIETKCPDTIYNGFVSNADDNWMTFLIDLASYAKYEYNLDELGRVLFSPKQDTASLQPVWTYDDSNSSIVCPTFTLDHDLYGIPNSVEVIYSDGKNYYYSKVVNNDSNSPTSIQARGREIPHRITNPQISGIPTQDMIDEFAKRTLRELSTLEYTLSYTHGYNNVRIGDCIRFDYASSGLRDIKAKVVSQSIKCEAGCIVSEKAVFTKKLWG